MICLRCDNEEFVETPDVEIDQEFRGELFKVRTAAQSCTMCGWVSVTPAQADELRRRTADAYRKRHGLLTSEEIRGMRRAMGKSQREFARYLNVGEASVKRWETWQVQDKSSDRLIRLKFLADLHAAAVEATKQTYIYFYWVEQQAEENCRTCCEWLFDDKTRIYTMNGDGQGI